MSETKPKAKPKHRIRWWFIVILSCLFLFFLAIAGGVVYLAHEVFQDFPMQPELMAASPEDTSAVFRKTQPFVMKVLASSPGQVAEMHLTGGEINATIVMIADQQKMAAFGGGKMDWPEGFALKFENRQVICNYSRKVNFDTPFGSYINTRVEWQPDVHNGKIDFKIASIRVGNLEVKPEWVKSAIMKELEKKPEELKKFKKIIVDMYVNQDGLLVVRYYPYEIKLMIQELMAKNFR